MLHVGLGLPPLFGLETPIQLFSLDRLVVACMLNAVRFGVVLHVCNVKTF